MKIALIDDSATTLVVLRTLCAKACDCETVTFTESKSAIDYLETTAVALIVVDYSMPGVTGTELIKRVRSSSTNAQTPVIMITASVEELVRRRAREVGAAAVLHKPVDPRAFHQILRESLQPLAIAR